MATGKTGADAISALLSHVCRILVRYQPKLQDLAQDLADSSVLTAEQVTTFTTFLSIATAACAVFQIMADHSGIN